MYGTTLKSELYSQATRQIQQQQPNWPTEWFEETYFANHRNAIKDAGKKIEGMLLEFSKVLDKVVHQCLVTKIHRDDFHEWVRKWVQSFLKGHTQNEITDSF